MALTSHWQQLHMNVVQKMAPAPSLTTSQRFYQVFPFTWIALQPTNSVLFLLMGALGKSSHRQLIGL